MRMTSRDNLSQVMQDLDRFASSISDVAVPRALNALRDQAQTAGLREIAAVYEIGPRTMEKYVTVKPATGSDPQAEIQAKGRGFPVSVYRPVPNNKGVTISIKGRRIQIPHAFILKKSGRFVARGAYGGRGIQATGEALRGFAFGRKRFPIGMPASLSASGVFGSRTVTEAMDARVAEQAGKVLAREISAARRGF